MESTRTDGSAWTCECPRHSTAASITHPIEQATLTGLAGDPTSGFPVARLRHHQ